MGEFSWKQVKSRLEMKEFFISVLPGIRKAARECGYAIGVHGSLMRDFDLIAVPWVEDFKSKDVLAEEIHKAACGISSECYQWEKKTGQRYATCMPICWPDFYLDRNIKSLGHIDLSVIEFREPAKLEGE